jgi:hypothetical protein
MPGVGSGSSRGMAVTINETTMQVSPVLSVDLNGFSSSGGSAQLLGNGNYFFAAHTGHRYRYAGLEHPRAAGLPRLPHAQPVQPADQLEASASQSIK